MLNITIPATATIVSGLHFAGWTWFVKDHSFKVMRFFYYAEDTAPERFQLVYFYREENYEQFRDELDIYGREKSNERAAAELPAGSVHYNGSVYIVRDLSEADKRALRQGGVEG